MTHLAPVSPLDPRPHAVIIGSGFGGLAAAVRLGARGYRCTILEKLDAPGGRAYVFRQDGFTFDGGPTIVTAPFLLEELWALCGKTLSDDVDLRPITPFYRIRFDDGVTFDYTGDADAMRAEVARFRPADVAGYDAFMRASEGDLPRGLRTSGPRAVRALDGHGEAGAATASPGQPAQRARAGGQIRQGRTAAHGAELPSAAGGRQPVRRQLHLQPDLLPGTTLGRAFRHGGARARWSPVWQA